MTDYLVSVRLEGMPDGRTLAASLFPRVSAMVGALAEQAAGKWRAYALGAPLPNGKISPRSGAYAKSINWERTGDFSARVYSDSPYAGDIENGAPARDLKRMLDTSFKVRRTKTGERYLIIPFQHGTPGTTGFSNVMPQPGHNAWMQKDAAGNNVMAPSRVKGMTSRVSGTGAWDVRTKAPYLVDQRQYQWGARMTKEHLNRLGVFGEKARHMAGMVRMHAPGHTQYLTFRVMKEGSPGWITKPKAGLYPAKTTSDWLQSIAKDAFGQAVMRDSSKGI